MITHNELLHETGEELLGEVKLKIAGILENEAEFGGGTGNKLGGVDLMKDGCLVIVVLYL